MKTTIAPPMFESYRYSIYDDNDRTSISLDDNNKNNQ